MIIHKVRFRNVLGFGNYWTEIQLDKNDLTIVTGKNGSGKSSMLLDTITYAFYGSMFRDINKDGYVNSITKKEMVVELYFSIGKDEFKIIRGVKPDIFEIYENGVLIPQNSNKAGYQDYLEVNIIKCGIKTFKQIVVLGSTDYVPFLKLKTPERRAVVENILDLELISVMNSLLKKDASALAESIRQKETGKELLNTKIKTMNEALLKNKNNIEEEIKKYTTESNDITEQIERKKNEFKTVLCDIESIKEQYKKEDELVKKWNDKLVRCDTELERFKKELGFYEHTKVCPTCHQNLEPNFVLRLIDEKKSDISKYENGKQIIIDKLKNFNDNKTELGNTIQDHNTTLSHNEKISREIKYLESKLQNLLQFIEDKKKTAPVIDESELSTLGTDLAVLNHDLNELYGERNIQQILLKILKDDGGKSQAVQRYITDLNNIINKFLIDMNFFVEFYLDENFDEVIKSRYRDKFSYNSFSDGQKLRINLAILFAWRELAKRRNSVSINLLVFDEILSGSLDADGVSDLIDILKKFHHNENIFLITHGEGGMARVEETIKVSMVSGFSRVDQG